MITMVFTVVVELSVVYLVGVGGRGICSEAELRAWAVCMVLFKSTVA